MEHLINKRVLGIQESAIRQFFNRVSQMDGAISLTLGQPDFPTPDHIKESAKRAIDANHTVYTHNAGLLELRETVRDFIQHRYDLVYDPQDEIIITNGATEALHLAFQTLLEEGSEVILPGPAYPGYEAAIRLAGGIPVYVDTTRTKFHITVDMIAEALTANTRCVVLPFPSNPTGITLSEEELRMIADFLEERDVFVVSDEIYSELLFAHTHCSIARFSKIKEKTVVIQGLSKSHSMTGWRIGMTLAPAYLTRQMLKVHQYTTTCASTISQYAALEALRNGMHDPQVMVRDYQERADYVYHRMQQMGLEVNRPQGALYLFPSIRQFGMKSVDFATELLEQYRLAVVPGDAFSEYGEGYIRISFAYSLEVLKEAMDRLEHFVCALRNHS